MWNSLNEIYSIVSETKKSQANQEAKMKPQFFIKKINLSFIKHIYKTEVKIANKTDSVFL